MSEDSINNMELQMRPRPMFDYRVEYTKIAQRLEQVQAENAALKAYVCNLTDQIQEIFKRMK